MPVPYSLDLCWRIVWAYLARKLSFAEIAATFSICERTVRRYVALFQSTGDILVSTKLNGPKPILGELCFYSE